MGGEIKEACLSVDDDQVFVSFNAQIIKTATPEFYRRFKSNVWSCLLPTPLLKIPRRGQRLRITNWHHGMPVKIEAKYGRNWEVIFERHELPTELECLAGCGEENIK